MREGDSKNNSTVPSTAAIRSSITGKGALNWQNIDQDSTEAASSSYLIAPKTLTLPEFASA